MASPDLVRILLSTYLFQDLSPVHLEPLIAASRVRDYRAGQYLHCVGDRADELYVLLAGMIKESMPTADGYEYVAELLHPGGIFGEPGIFVPERTRIVDELVLEDASVLVIDRETLWTFLQQHPPVMLRLLEGLAAGARESLEVMAGIALRRVRQRVIFRLLELAATQGNRTLARGGCRSAYPSRPWLGWSAPAARTSIVQSPASSLTVISATAPGSSTSMPTACAGRSLRVHRSFPGATCGCSRSSDPAQGKQAFLTLQVCHTLSNSVLQRLHLE